jgi:ABC-type multidrug transport system permease subunit
MVGPSDLPGFWIFMYRVSPLTYLIGAMLSAGLAKTPVTCSEVEIILVQPPRGKSCIEYFSAFLQTAPGKVYNPSATENCQFCPMTSSDTFLASVSSVYGDRWRNLGLIWVYIVVNIVTALALYWLIRVPKSGGVLVTLVQNPLQYLRRKW